MWNSEIFYVPEVKMNVLSVSKLESNNAMNAFLNNQLVMLRTKLGSLYKVEFEIGKSSCNYTLNKFDNVKLLNTQDLVNGLNITEDMSNISGNNFFVNHVY